MSFGRMARLLAEDVEFTYKKLIDPAVPTPYSGGFFEGPEFRGY